MSSIARWSTGFKAWGKGEEVAPETVFERRVLHRAQWWGEYGCPVDPGELPVDEYDAHMAILQGKAEKQKEEKKKADREQQKTKRVGS